MRIKNLLAQFNQSSIGMKIGIIGVILIWLLPFVAIVGGLIFYYAEQTGQALEPKPGQTIPVIMLEPSTGSLGTLVTVKGEGWPAGSPVLVYLIPPDETTLPAYAITSVVADSAGRFTIGFVFPAEPRWESQATATVIVQTEAGRLSARASFSLVRPEAFVPETPSPTLEPAATAVVIETEEPTVTIEPTATPTLVAPTPTATPQPSPPSLTATTDLNIRSGPGLTYAIIGLLPAGQTANITGLSADGGWWQIEYSGVPTGRGWVSSRYVVVQNVSTVPILPAPPVLIIPPPAPTPTPVPTPTPAPIIVDWRGEYYPNRDLAGAPALVRNDVAVDFNWGFGSPAPGLPADDFSARWTRTWNFSEGTHRFHVAVDDGVRLYVDNALVIDSWQDGGRRELAAERWLWGGSHSLQIEYYEHLGEASILVWAEKVSGAGPEADFDADPRSGRVPLRVEFDNDSSGDYDRCEWEFGDDHDSDDCDNPDHTYREAGNYTVRLKVWGPNDSDTRERDDYITVRPIANFAATPTSGPRPLVVNFTNLSTPYDRCEWAFGDGGVSYDCNPSHTYTTRGLYTVSLIVTESGVRSDPETKTGYISVSNEPPVVAHPGDQNNAEGQTVSLQMVATDPDGDTLTYSAANLPPDLSLNPTTGLISGGLSYIAENSSPYAVMVTVSDGAALTSVTFNWIVTHTNQPPALTHPGDQNNAEGQTVSLQMVVTDPDGDALTYNAINLPPDLSLNSTTGLISGGLSYIAENSSPYAVVVTVSDGAALTSVTFNWIVTHTNQPPALAHPGDQSNAEGQTASLQMMATDPDGDVLSYSAANLPPDLSIDPGSGLVSGLLASNAAENSPYPVTVEVSDGEDSSGVTFNWVVTEPPQANFTADPTSGQAPLVVQFSDNSEGNITAWAWDFGDGTGSTEQSPAHTYTAASNYTVSLTVSGPGGSDTKTKENYITVTAPPAPKAKFEAEPTKGQAPLAVQFINNSEGDITAWEWNFGDGANSTEQSPAHTYVVAGDYTVSLTVSGPGGSDTKTKQDYITVTAPPAPEAKFDAEPTTGQAPLTVQFNNRSEGEYISCLWDFGDGSTSTEENPAHIYQNASLYSVSLTVSGPGGNDTEAKANFITVTEPPMPELPPPPPAPSTPIPAPPPLEPTTPAPEPPRPTPEPPTLTPEPPTPIPEPPTPAPEPPTPIPTPEPPTPTPERPTPEPPTPIPPIDTPTPERAVPLPEPATLTPTPAPPEAPLAILVRGGRLYWG